MALISHYWAHYHFYRFYGAPALLYRGARNFWRIFEKVLQVNNQPDQEEGSYQFVTVGVKHARMVDLFYAWLTPFTDIHSAKEMTGGSSDAEFMRINQFYMETSQNMAKYQGLKSAGKEIELKYLGVYVLTVTDNSTF